MVPVREIQFLGNVSGNQSRGTERSQINLHIKSVDVLESHL